jgi:hypothetical protein
MVTVSKHRKPTMSEKYPKGGYACIPYAGHMDFTELADRLNNALEEVNKAKTDS